MDIKKSGRRDRFYLSSTSEDESGEQEALAPAANQQQQLQPPAEVQSEAQDAASAVPGLAVLSKNKTFPQDAPTSPLPLLSLPDFCVGRSKPDPRIHCLKDDLTLEQLKREWTKVRSMCSLWDGYSGLSLLITTPKTTIEQQENASHDPQSCCSKDDSTEQPREHSSSSGKPETTNSSPVKKETFVMLHFDGIPSGSNKTAGSSSIIGANAGTAEHTQNAPGSMLQRRHVAFADELGFPLAEVRVMHEPSDVPPDLNSAVVRALIYNNSVEVPEVELATWALTFEQPISDYLMFRKRLYDQSVALENIRIYNSPPYRLYGVVKVRDVAFSKDVFVRLTVDNWTRYKDHKCGYLGGLSENNFDAFFFDIEIPKNDQLCRRIEFCIGYRVWNAEYWDNNGGSNFAVEGS
jgi:protein phosphatase 1 regulatory subunit 3A/B/C/D/E